MSRIRTHIAYAVEEEVRTCPDNYTAIIEKEGDGYVALCPDLDVASQGTTVEEATANLKEEVQHLLHTEIFVTRFEAARG